MRPIKHLQLCTILFVLCTAFSCKKRDALSDVAQKDELVAQRFFSLPSKISPSALRVNYALKQINSRTGFILQLANQAGFAVWDKAIVQLPQRNHGRNTIAVGDTLVYIPLVLANDNHVNAFIYARLNDSVSLKLYRSYEYASHGFGGLHDDAANAEKLAVQFMLLDFETFGHERFQVLDDSLLQSAPLPSNAIKSQRLAHINKTQTNFANRSGYETWEYDICMNIRYLDCNDNHRCCPDGSCAGCKVVCWKTRFECQTVAFMVFVDDDDWSLTGTGNNGSGGGGAGTASNNGMTPCNPTSLIDNGLLPCPRGGTPGWVPYIPAIVNEVDYSEVSDSCLRALLQHIDISNHSSFILKTYYELPNNNQPTAQHKYRLKYKQDTSLRSDNGLPIPGRTFVEVLNDGTNFVTVLLNPTLLHPSSKEWVTTVILHELVHGMIMVVSPSDSTSVLQHKFMFDNKIPLRIGRALVDLFPQLSPSDAVALGMDGLSEVYLIPDPNNLSGLPIIDPGKDAFAFNSFNQNILSTIATAQDYYRLLQGIPFC